MGARAPGASAATATATAAPEEGGHVLEQRDGARAVVPQLESLQRTPYAQFCTLMCCKCTRMYSYVVVLYCGCRPPCLAREGDEEVEVEDTAREPIMDYQIMDYHTYYIYHMGVRVQYVHGLGASIKNTVEKSASSCFPSASYA